jgi:YebC/PmpR family DNA-binding regulatory protein
MAGHSKWANRIHRKSRQDQKRGKMFGKLSREIIVAARLGGGDPLTNNRLRLAMESARGASMPVDNIERAIKRGTGELPGVTYERLTYEGYGPHGIAILVEVLTDSRNRTSAELRKIFSQRGGKMEGSVAWMFEAKGLLTVPADAIGEDELMELAINAGADDLVKSDSTYEITTAPTEFHKVKQALLDKGLTPSVAELTRLPQTLIKLEGDAAQKALALLEELEDHDDVQNVHTNLDVPADLAAAKG